VPGFQSRDKFEIHRKRAEGPRCEERSGVNFMKLQQGLGVLAVMSWRPYCRIQHCCENRCAATPATTARQ